MSDKVPEHREAPEVEAFTVVDGRITAISAMVAPAKLALMGLPGPS